MKTINTLEKEIKEFFSRWKDYVCRDGGGHKFKYDIFAVL
jgi:hypothetical protein